MTKTRIEEIQDVRRHLDLAVRYIKDDERQNIIPNHTTINYLSGEIPIKISSQEEVNALQKEIENLADDTLRLVDEVYRETERMEDCADGGRHELN